MVWTLEKFLKIECEKCGTSFDISSLYDEEFECPKCGYKHRNSLNKKFINELYNKFNQSLQRLEDLKELYSDNYIDFINKSTTKKFLSKILQATKPFYRKNNYEYGDLIFDDHEIELIEKIQSESLQNAPFGDYIQDETTLELLDYIIGNIHFETQAEFAKEPKYVSYKYHLVFNQQEWEILDDFAYYLTTFE